jgi:hypothetical protein
MTGLVTSAIIFFVHVALHEKIVPVIVAASYCDVVATLSLEADTLGVTPLDTAVGLFTVNAKLAVAPAAISTFTNIVRTPLVLSHTACEAVPLCVSENDACWPVLSVRGLVAVALPVNPVIVIFWLALRACAGTSVTVIVFDAPVKVVLSVTVIVVNVVASPTTLPSMSTGPANVDAVLTLSDVTAMVGVW